MRSGSEVRSGGSVTIHPSAIVHSDAEIGEGVEIGPFCCIAGTVKIGPNTTIGSRVTIEGNTTIGAYNEIFTGAVIGSRTQDKKFDGGVSYLRIGDYNKIREYVTVNPGTKDGTETVIGDHNLMMAYAHVAHDCVIKNHAVLANNATLAGHVIVGHRAIIGGLSAVHQFVRIGDLALIGGCSKVTQDVPPFMIVDGHPVRAFGVNSVGLDRANFTRQQKTLLKKAFKVIFRSGMTLKGAVEELKKEPLFSIPPLNVLLEFLSASERGVCR